MAKEKAVKTNAMRILDREKIPYEFRSYECEEFVDGKETADKLGLPHEEVYKTLVTISHSKKYYVFVIPIDAELDMKKAARAVNEKSVEMIHVKDITTVTGYVRGGCTAIGMKKQYDTVIDSTAENFQKIHVSAGKIGAQITLSPQDLAKAAKAKFVDIIA
ncbi:MAG: Cys-tRNA(Pro) deacylase [Lachnospiraceae bacterium]|nr:Cys-tRNA(Pro) deacylase [Lachnospiraceae bacterium]